MNNKFKIQQNYMKIYPITHDLPASSDVTFALIISEAPPPVIACRDAMYCTYGSIGTVTCKSPLAIVTLVRSWAGFPVTRSVLEMSRKYETTPLGIRGGSQVTTRCERLRNSSRFRGFEGASGKGTVDR